MTQIRADSLRPTLVRSRKAVSAVFWLIGFSLTFYLGFATFGLFRNSSEHYSNFVLAVLTMSGLVAVRSLLDERIEGAARRHWAGHMAFAVLALVLAAGSSLYVRLNAVALEINQPFFTDVQFAVGIVLTVSVLMLNWIHWGGVLTSIIGIMILYFFYGHLIASPVFGHPPLDPKFVMNYIGLGTTDGFFWFARDAADSLYFLVIFAAALFGAGMLRMVIELGKYAGRYVTGGAAYPALIGSGILASVMGVAVSNVVMTGRFTIPMMKRYGYSPSMAGSIEAVASCSGQIMPPVLGLAAFLIAAILNVAYVEIALAAVIPGALYLTGTFIGVQVYANRHKLPRLDESVDFKLIKRMLPTFVISFAAVVVLLVGYYSPSIAGIVGSVLALGLAVFQGPYRPSRQEIIGGIEEGFVMVAVLSLLLIAIGPLGQVMLTTNLSGRLGPAMLDFLPDNKWLLLIGAMVLSLLLGMGLPTPVAYIVVALTLVPFLQELGVPALIAHFFVFYFACYSTLTPPVAVSVLAAARLAETSFLKTAIDSMKLCSTTFVIPFAFVTYPQLLEFPKVGWNQFIPIATVLLLQWSASIAAFGHFRRTLSSVEQSLFTLVTIAGYVSLMDEGYASNAVFAALTALAVGMVYFRPLAGANSQARS
ncbi:MAG: TRAP transporter fused permease subunit [Rhodospirillales bacterium]|nr:TRAP transporter fused permease subunit [Rhodospirillales bacterium]